MRGPQVRQRKNEEDRECVCVCVSLWVSKCICMSRCVCVRERECGCEKELFVLHYSEWLIQHFFHCSPLSLSLPPNKWIGMNWRKRSISVWKSRASDQLPDHLRIHRLHLSDDFWQLQRLLTMGTPPKGKKLIAEQRIVTSRGVRQLTGGKAASSGLSLSKQE